MIKNDFSIFLEPIETGDAQNNVDVTTVTNLGNIAQQIKSIILTERSERPFSPYSAPDLEDAPPDQNIAEIVYDNRIWNTLQDNLLNVNNIVLSWEKVTPNLKKYTVTFNYLTPEQVIQSATVIVEKVIL